MDKKQRKATEQQKRFSKLHPITLRAIIANPTAKAETRAKAEIELNSRWARKPKHPKFTARGSATHAEIPMGSAGPLCSPAKQKQSLHVAAIAVQEFL